MTTKASVTAQQAHKVSLTVLMGLKGSKSKLTFFSLPSSYGHLVSHQVSQTSACVDIQSELSRNRR